MNVFINEKATEVPAEASVAQIVALLGIPEKGTAIALNGSLCKRDAWADTALCDGDKLLVISAAYGG